MGRLGRGASILLAAATGMAATAVPAQAAVTIGQVVDGSASACDANADILQTTVPSGATNVVPGTGTITSWTTLVTAPPVGQVWTMKVFRKVGEPNVYQAVGHSGP